MSFLAFIQDNILLFAMTTAVLGALVTMEVRGFQTRGANLNTTGLSQAVNAGAMLVDLRSHDDFRTSHIAGAKNIPFEELDNHMNTLGNKDSDIVFYCYSGSTSGKTIAKLRKAGFANVKHLSGGMNAWKADNLPTTKG